jgi:hypothetical protein
MNSRWRWVWVGLGVILAVLFVLGLTWGLVTVLPANDITPFSGLLAGIAALAVAALTVALLILNRQLAEATVAMARQRKLRPPRRTPLSWKYAVIVRLLTDRTWIGASQ